MNDPDKIIERLEAYVTAADEVHQQMGQYRTNVARSNANAGILGAVPSDSEAFEGLPTGIRTKVLDLEPSVARILAAVDDALMSQFQESRNYRRRADLVRQAIATVHTQDEVDEWLGPAAPAPDPRALHPVVAGPATVCWDAGQYRVAVDEAAKAVNVYLQTRLGRRNLNNTDLVRQAFSTSSPAPAEPRLRFPDVDLENDRKSWTSRHQGAMEFGAGLYQAVRNITAHADPAIELEPHYALDCLSAFSLLARWIDECELRTGGP